MWNVVMQGLHVCRYGTLSPALATLRCLMPQLLSQEALRVVSSEPSPLMIPNILEIADNICLRPIGSCCKRSACEWKLLSDMSCHADTCYHSQGFTHLRLENVYSTEWGSGWDVSA